MHFNQFFSTRGLRAVLEQLRWFAGTQIRNVAAVGGNIVTASPISDLNPVWMAMVYLQLFSCFKKKKKKRIVYASTFLIFSPEYRSIDDVRWSLVSIFFFSFVPLEYSPSFTVSRIWRACCPYARVFPWISSCWYETEWSSCFNWFVMLRFHMWWYWCKLDESMILFLFLFCLGHIWRIFAQSWVRVHLCLQTSASTRRWYCDCECWNAYGHQPWIFGFFYGFIGWAWWENCLRLCIWFFFHDSILYVDIRKQFKHGREERKGQGYMFLFLLFRYVCVLFEIYNLAISPEFSKTFFVFFLYSICPSYLGVFPLIWRNGSDINKCVENWVVFGEFFFLAYHPVDSFFLPSFLSLALFARMVSSYCFPSIFFYF